MRVGNQTSKLRLKEVGHMQLEQRQDNFPSQRNKNLLLKLQELSLFKNKWHTISESGCPRNCPQGSNGAPQWYYRGYQQLEPSRTNCP